MLDKLRTMYPEKAAEIERQFESKYGNLKDSAEEAGSDLQNEWDARIHDDSDNLRSHDESSDSEKSSDSSVRRKEPAKDTRRDDTRSRSESSDRSVIHDNNRAADEKDQ